MFFYLEVYGAKTFSDSLILMGLHVFPIFQFLIELTCIELSLSVSISIQHLQYHKHKVFEIPLWVFVCLFHCCLRRGINVDISIIIHPPTHTHITELQSVPAQRGTVFFLLNPISSPAWMISVWYIFLMSDIKKNSNIGIADL